MSDPAVPKVAPWEDVILRVIAIYKFIKAGLALALGLALFHFIHKDVNHFLHDYIAAPLHFDIDNPNVDNDSENRFLRWLFNQAASLTPHTMRMSAYFSFFCATVFAAEGIGLYLKKHWAEYLVIVVTGLPLPFEVYLLLHHVFWWKIVLITGNLLIIAYLAHRLRLDYLNRQAALTANEEKKIATERDAARAVPSGKTETSRATSDVP